MKFFISTFIVLPILASLVAGLIVPEPDLVARQNGKGGGDKKSGSSASASAAATTSTSSSTSASGGGDNDPQTSLTLDPGVIAKGFENDGQNQPAAGQVASLTSSNNFINFCLTVANQPITNGQQISGGSCNPAPMGSIPSTANMPSAKFTNPKNLDTIPANQAFTISLAIQGMETGHFVNAQENYFSAPQQLNGQGQIQGHSHVVIEQLSSLTQTTPTDPTKFAFFKGLNDAAQNGILTADVTDGLPEGTFKISTINTSSNHQPVAVPVAQHGSLDDVVYFTVSNDAGGGGGGGGGGGASSTSTTSAAANASAATTSTGNGNGGGNGGGKGGGGKGKGNRRGFLPRLNMNTNLD